MGVGRFTMAARRLVCREASLSTWLSGRRVTLSACVVIASIQRHQVADAGRDACLNVCTQGQAPQLFVIEELDEGKPQKSSPSAPILTILSCVL